MINKDEKIIIYLNSTVDNVFKILPLFEEKNIGLESYIESLLIELYGLQEVVDVRNSSEYITILSVLEGLKKEISNKETKKPVIKREVFKCIGIVKNLISSIDGE